MDKVVVVFGEEEFSHLKKLIAAIERCAYALEGLQGKLAELVKVQAAE